MNWVAGSLALMAPFVSLLRYYDYPLLRPESAGYVAFLAILGLPLGWWLGQPSRRSRAIAGGLTLALFCEYQFYQSMHEPWSFPMVLALGAGVSWLVYEQLPTILAAVFATFLLTTLVFSVDPVSSFELGSGEPERGAPTLPITLHLILDEQVGVGAVPSEIAGARELARELEEFFVDRGFRVFARSFSSFFNTRNSLSHIANLHDEYTEGLSQRGVAPFEWAVSRNDYFDRMAERGYRVRVTQSDYLDFCQSESARPAECRTYRAWSLAFAADAPWPPLAKWQMFARLYPLHSNAYALVRKGYATIRSAGTGAGVPLPEWSWELMRAPSVESLVEMTRLEAQAEAAARGDLFFAHLLMPHSPYAYDRDCVLKPPSMWRDHKDRTRPSEHSNSPERRRDRYRAHFEQVSCVLKRFDRVLEALARNPNAEDAVVVVHGDHGARIGLLDARMKNRDKLSPADYLDSFATVFAVRAPGIEPGSVPRIVSIQSLFRSLVEGDFRKPPELGLEDFEPTVYFTASQKRVVGSGPMVGFDFEEGTETLNRSSSDPQ